MAFRIGEITKQMDETIIKEQNFRERGGAEYREWFREYSELSTELIQLLKETSDEFWATLYFSVIRRPGWSIVPVKMHITEQIHEFLYAHRGGDPEEPWYLSHEDYLDYAADGLGYLIYTKDYEEFEIFVAPKAVDKVNVSQLYWNATDWIRETNPVDITGGRGYIWRKLFDNGPKGPWNVTDRYLGAEGRRENFLHLLSETDYGVEGLRETFLRLYSRAYSEPGGGEEIHQEPYIHLLFSPANPSNPETLSAGARMGLDSFRRAARVLPETITTPEIVFSETDSYSPDFVQLVYSTHQLVGGGPQLQITPAIVETMVNSGNFSKTVSWHFLYNPEDPGDQSRIERSMTIQLQIGKPPPEQPGVLVVSPSDGFSSSRTGPEKDFEPLSKTYTVKNNGRQAIQFSVSKNAAWLELDNTTGSIEPGGSASLTVSIKIPEVSRLTENTYKDTIIFTNTTNNKGNTSRPAELTISEEEQWHVSLIGYEIDEMDPYWRLRPEEEIRIRGAIRFNYKLEGEFTIFKKKGKWRYKGGNITIAEIELLNLYQPLEAWEVKPLKCQNCYQVTNLRGTTLSGFVEENIVKLQWGNKKPKVDVKARIICPCIPMPDCAKWGQRLYISEEFFDRINNVPLPLIHGGIVTPSELIIDPQGSQWLHYKFILRRLR